MTSSCQFDGNGEPVECSPIGEPSIAVEPIDEDPIAISELLTTMKVKKPKRVRRSQVQMEEFRDAIVRVALANAKRKISVRQIDYVLVSEGLIEKTHERYASVIDACLKLRQAGRIPWDIVVDNTRFSFTPNTYRSIEEKIRVSIRSFRQSLWDDVDLYVQVWCESMSIAGVIKEITDRWDTELYPGRGYSSHVFLRDAAHLIASIGKPTLIYILGDYDPRGQDIIRFSKEMLEFYAREVTDAIDIRFELLAVTHEQIERWNLPGNEPKKSDTCYAKSGIEWTVELEAIPPEEMCSLVENALSSHLPPGILEWAEEEERQQKATARRRFAKFRDAEDFEDEDFEDEE